MKTLTASECASILQDGQVSVLSGAGVSTSAGIPDFRGPKGLYVTRQYDPNVIFDIECFTRNPRPFFDFSRDFLESLQNVQPTFTHRFLVALEQEGILESIITQNIDPLHQQAGSKKMICLHGNYFTAHCRNCTQAYVYPNFISKIKQQAVPICDRCNGVIKPDVVFFGETVNGIEDALGIVSDCRTLLVLGSSLVVYPAALLPQYAQRVVVVNKGDVNLSPSLERYHIRDDLDNFFLQVANELSLPSIHKLLNE